MTQEKRELVKLLDAWKSKELDKHGGHWGSKLDVPEPLFVKKARHERARWARIVERWERNQRKKIERRRARVHRRYNEMRALVFFSPDASSAFKKIKRTVQP